MSDDATKIYPAKQLADTLTPVQEPDGAATGFAKKKPSLKAKQKAKKRRKWAIIGIVAVLLLGGGFFVSKQVFGSGGSGAGEYDPEAIFSGDLANVTREDVTKTITLDGSLESTTAEVIYSSINAKVTALNVKPGDRVAKGQQLAQLDTSELRQQLASQQAEIAQSQAAQNGEINAARQRYQQLLNAYNHGQSEEILAAQRAYRDATRERNSVKQVISSLQEQLRTAGTQTAAELRRQLQEARENATTAEENVQAAQDGIQAAKNAALQQVNDAAATVEAAQSNAGVTADQQQALEKIRQDINAGTVIAPLDGVVTQVMAKVGAMSEGSLLAIADDKNLIIKTAVKESNVSKLAVGNTVTFTTPATGKQEYAGVVGFVSPAAGGDSVPADTSGKMYEPSQGDSGSGVTFPVEIKVTGNVNGLRIGSSVKAKAVTEGQKAALAVPKGALVDAAVDTEDPAFTKPDNPEDWPQAILQAQDDGQGNIKVTEIPVTVLVKSGGMAAIKGKGIAEDMQILNNASQYTHLVNQSGHLTDTPPSMGQTAISGVY